MSLKKKKVPYGLFLQPVKLIWLSLLFNQKPLATYMNYFSQKEKLRSILETSILKKTPKNLNSSHLLSRSFNLKILVGKILALCYKNDSTRTRLCYNRQRLQEFLREAELKPNLPNILLLQSGNAAWGPGWRSMVFVTWQIKKQGNSCAKASGTWKIIDCNSQKSNTLKQTKPK